MDKEQPERPRVGRVYEFRVKAINHPPGQRPKGQHLSYEDPDDVRRRWRLIAAGAAAAALAVGLLAGRFLLP